VTSAGRGAVVDASVAIKWRLNDEELLDEARFLLQRFLRREILLAAPAFIRYELANTLDQARRRGRIPHEQVGETLRYLLLLGVHMQADSDALVQKAARLAGELDISAYDGMYVALAEELDLVLVSEDRRLLRRIGDYPVATAHLADVGSML
jgi:predicted nucleic acid-binding protein